MILLVDNYDSFTYNLAQALRSLGARVLVRRNDAIDRGTALALGPEALVLSPGPGRPEDAGCLLDLVDAFLPSTPILGVCLGHQAIGLHAGARLARAPRPLHGKATPLRHAATGLFAGLPSPLLAGRYHSLALERETLPPSLRVTAEDADGTVMALEHTALPVYGVQFHPESVLTPRGPELLRRFLALASERPRAA